MSETPRKDPMTTCYGYICPTDKQLHTLPDDYYVAASAERVKVQCESCNAFHPCRPLAELEGQAELPEGDAPNYRPSGLQCCGSCASGHSLALLAHEFRCVHDHVAGEPVGLFAICDRWMPIPDDIPPPEKT